MDLLKAQFKRIQEQLAGLTATQKMLAVSLVAIMVLTMMFWARYASNSDMVPVLDQAFTDEQVARATMLFKSQDIDCKVVGDRVMVSSDRQAQALAVLGYAQLLPADTKSAFDQIIAQTNPFDPKDKNDVMFTRAKAAELAQIIGGFPGVATAHVVINPVMVRSIGNETKPSGVVTIATRGNANAKQLVESAASTVASATSGLDRSRVAVVIDARTYHTHDDAAGGIASDEIYDRIQQEEQHYQDKIAVGLSNYNSPLITVSVDLEMQSSQESATTYDPKGVVQKEISTESKTSETNQTSPSASEPGVVPNTGMSLAPSGGGANTSTTEDAKTNFENRFASKTEWTNKPAGHAAVVAAAVALPRSHFLDLYKEHNPSAKDVDDDMLQKSSASELSGVKQRVMAACGLVSDAKVFVGFYADATSPLNAGEPIATAGSTASIAVAGHIKEIAIAVLAALSLFMVSMMVKKGAPAPAIAMGPSESVELEGPSYVAGDEEVSGIVGAGINTMDGMELDDDSIKAQQMVEQVTTMVQENPDAAAMLVKRWMNRS